MRRADQGEEESNDEAVGRREALRVESTEGTRSMSQWLWRNQIRSLGKHQGYSRLLWRIRGPICAASSQDQEASRRHLGGSRGELRWRSCGTLRAGISRR